MGDSGTAPRTRDPLGLDGVVAELARATDDFAALPEVATRAVGDLLQGTTVLYVLEIDGRTIRLLAGWHPHEATRIDLADLGGGVELQRGQGFLGMLLEHGQSFFRPSIAAEELQAVNASYLEYFARHGLTGMILVPLTARDQRIGMLGISRHTGQEPFVDADFALVQQVAGHLALAVDNARLLALAREEIAERKKSERRLRHQATHDSLTGLPNRVLLRERLTALSTQRSDDPAARSSALLFLDLDGFKDVNDGLGHEAGDAVLRQLADRMLRSLPADAFLARLGGDEFAVLLESADPPAVEVAHTVRAALVAPAWAGGQPVHLGGSIGVATTSDGSDQPADLMRRADLAMYRAKQTGEGVCVFDDVIDGPQANRLGRLGALRRAIEVGELRLHWQPILDLASDTVCSLEALVRWQRRDRLVPPDEFIPLAEQSGLILPLTRWVVDAAATEYAARGNWPDTISINLATQVLAEPGVAADLAARLAARQVPPEAVTFEISEASLLDARARDGLQECADAGFGLAIDDFGTGYASFAYLKDLVVDVVKIDRSFVRALAGDRRDEAIVGSIAFVARRLGLRTVAEGVEDEGALQVLRDLGVDCAQGFLFAPGLPAVELDGWLAARAAARRTQEAHRFREAPAQEVPRQ